MDGSTMMSARSGLRAMAVQGRNLCPRDARAMKEPDRLEAISRILAHTTLHSCAGRNSRFPRFWRFFGKPAEFEIVS